MSASKKNATEGHNGAVAAEIRAELAARGLLREDLSRLSGVPLDSLKNYLSTNPTRARMMDLDVAAALAEALGMTLVALVSRASGRRVGA